MTRTSALKKPVHGVRSRFAKRATSPSIDLDRSLTEAKLPRTAPVSHKNHSVRPASVIAMHAATGAGVSKKNKGSRPMSRKARERLEKGLEMAERVMGRTEEKVLKSKDRAKAVEGRRAGWDDLNQKIEDEEGASLQTKKAKGHKVVVVQEEVEGGEWDDVLDEEEIDCLPDAEVAILAAEAEQAEVHNIS